MPKAGTICTHSERQEIDQQLVAGAAMPQIAAIFRVSEDALGRHKRHLGYALVRAAARREEDLGDSLYGDLQDLRARTLNLLQAAERSGNAAATVALIREACQNVMALSDLSLRAGAGSENVIRVTVERIGAPDVCPHCGEKVELIPEAGGYKSQ